MPQLAQIEARVRRGKGGVSAFTKDVNREYARVQKKRGVEAVAPFRLARFKDPALAASYVLSRAEGKPWTDAEGKTLEPGAPDTVMQEALENLVGSGDKQSKKKEEEEKEEEGKTSSGGGRRTRSSTKGGSAKKTKRQKKQKKKKKKKASTVTASIQEEKKETLPETDVSNASRLPKTPKATKVPKASKTPKTPKASSRKGGEEERDQKEEDLAALKLSDEIQQRTTRLPSALQVETEVREERERKREERRQARRAERHRLRPKRRSSRSHPRSPRSPSPGPSSPGGGTQLVVLSNVELLLLGALAPVGQTDETLRAFLARTVELGEPDPGVHEQHTGRRELLKLARHALQPSAALVEARAIDIARQDPRRMGVVVDTLARATRKSESQARSIVASLDELLTSTRHTLPEMKLSAERRAHLEQVLTQLDRVRAMAAVELKNTIAEAADDLALGGAPSDAQRSARALGYDRPPGRRKSFTRRHAGKIALGTTIAGGIVAAAAMKGWSPQSDSG